MNRLEFLQELLCWVECKGVGCVPEKSKKRTTKAKKNEEGYFERTTQAAREAAKKVHTIFVTPEEFTEAANGYFDDCDARNEVYGEAGLCLWLSDHNPKGRTVTLQTLRGWYDGTHNKDIQDAVQMAYLRIQGQIESDPRYREKGMSTRAIFLQKQPRFGGYQDKIENKTDTTVRIIHGDNMDESDFK